MSRGTAPGYTAAQPNLVVIDVIGPVTPRAPNRAISARTGALPTQLRRRSYSAFAPDVFERDAGRLVLAGVIGRDRPGAQGADARDQGVPAGGVRPGGTPVSEPGQQGVAGELAEALPVTGDGDARLGRSMSSRVSSRMALGRAACTAASAIARRWAGVTAADLLHRRPSGTSLVAGIMERLSAGRRAAGRAARLLAGWPSPWPPGVRGLRWVR